MKHEAWNGKKKKWKKEEKERNKRKEKKQTKKTKKKRKGKEMKKKEGKRKGIFLINLAWDTAVKIFLTRFHGLPNKKNFASIKEFGIAVYVRWVCMSWEWYIV